MRSVLFGTIVVLCACQAGKTQTPALQTPATPQLWLFLHSYLSNPDAVTLAESRIDAAKAAGYTGVVMWDSGIHYLQYSWWNPSYMQQVVQYARSKDLAVVPEVAPYGASYDELVITPNLAEGQQVVGTQFKVDPAGKTLQVVNSFPGLVNGGFEGGQAGWFSYGDPGSSVDNTNAHTGSASALLRNCPANCRLAQTFAVQPWRQYHIRLFYKTQGFSGYSQIEAFGDSNLGIQRVNQSFSLQNTQDWTQWDYTFNSGPHSSILILMGIWGGSQGSLWFDDISLEESGLVYVLRGNSTPLTVYDPNNPSHVFQENTDFGAISDPQLSGPTPYFGDYWHQPMVPTVPAGSSLHPGQIVAMNWYAIQPVAYDAGVSLTDPAALQWRASAAAGQAPIFGSASGYLFGYDEMRHMNSTASAKAMNMTPAQLLDWHFNQTYNLYRSYNPSATIYVWSDMFDPNHNAVNNYYLVEGDLTGSWTGIPSDVVMMNWNIGELRTSATWFATPPYAHRQILANYYDSGDGNASATNALAQVSGVPGIQGLMYTSWVEDYSQIAQFASAARTNWGSYLASLPSTGSTTGPPAGSTTGSTFKPVLINAGGGAYVDAQGKTWSADMNFSGGSIWTTTNTIASTASQALYQTCRYGEPEFSYNIPVPNGAYTVTLKFAEPVNNGPNLRVFNVAINGTQVLQNFDIWSAAGGMFIPVDKSFPVTVTNGQISIQFANGETEWPMVNAIQINAQ